MPCEIAQFCMLKVIVYEIKVDHETSFLTCSKTGLASCNCVHTQVVFQRYFKYKKPCDKPFRAKDFESMSQLDGLAVTIKVFLTILFVGCFVFNSFQIFLKFSEGETTTVIDIIDVEEGKMFYPVMTFCNKDGYKTEATDISDLEEYLNKTYDFEEIFEDFGIPSSYMFNEMITFKEYESTFTPFRGRCYTYRYPEKVLKTLFLMRSLCHPLIRSRSLLWIV